MPQMMRGRGCVYLVCQCPAYKKQAQITCNSNIQGQLYYDAQARLQGLLCGLLQQVGQRVRGGGVEPALLLL